MTHEVARVLATALMPMYNHQLVTVLGGLVKMALTDKGGKTVRFPVPHSDASQPMQIDNNAFIPDAKQRAIIYFEGTDSDIVSFDRDKSRMRTNLKLICWYNLNMFQVEGSNSVAVTLLNNVLGLLPSASALPGEILALKTVATKVIDKGPNLFSQYTYKEERSQYLQDPYYAFGIDLSCTYQINHTSDCHGKLIPVDTVECC
ncbi:hypothetical protein DYBT9275_02773 [Dyadobacter sp. CECT 9275]|uniref:Uncharacterized protein n=1 Tax=Dyadobacter helix TaxID=2822344 RepID=A0A916JCT5_9BACT|nr:hypothetical protein [Dyadobacter sp. CECT 9275]CAG5001948.1 hypothetical protein DYBT9275_02773 [Dyadobacter sp. CECT 9275]